MASAAIGMGISTIGSLIGAGMRSSAIKSAAATQANAATDAAAKTKAATDAANAYTQENLARTRGDIAPYQAAGVKALGQLGEGTAAGGQFNSTPTGEQVMAQDPGFAFRLSEGQKALERAASAGGSLASGGHMKAATEFGQNYASSEYNTAYQRFMATRESNYSNLANIANYGQIANQVDATAGTAASGLVAGTTLSGTHAQTGYLTDAADATAAGRMGTANAWAGAIGSIGTAAQGAAAQFNQSGYGGGGGLDLSGFAGAAAMNNKGSLGDVGFYK